ncbi:Wadjet anti-phage system protein JetD domain-containing protein [Iodobacter sp. LRB]|uniref:Wadjet anti-phage system protein JetD domain-containing protein n=1 Tax=unclassified Iodobacter TaxID=235634 RepID=UPI000C0D35AC|nr:Wadjet anti-phage system protein JetD domain-containing protein [Iodobacter sp. BJB302]PHV01946.1 hypothetical protein CSQ88_09595 [Iodobacter sp. BJB302]
MTWTTPIELHAQVKKLWDRGEILAALISGEPLFPKRLRLKGPSSAELSSHFDAARAWISELKTMRHCRITMREINHRTLGTNSLPDQAWIDTQENALALIGKTAEATRFKQLFAVTHNQQLHPWLAKRALRALELADDWPKLLAIVAWLQSHPQPGIYLRQVDLPDVHSKLIESHRGVLAELLDLALPPDAINSSATGITQFAQRYGFCDKPQRVRFRILDPAYALLANDADITLDAASFAQLKSKISMVFITENEVNFLAFPKHPHSMVIFGSGYGFDMLAQAQWLNNCQIYYWGDIDTHGFAILDQLRSHFPHVQSLLMDRQTLLYFKSQWGQEETPSSAELTQLNHEEAALFADLKHHTIRNKLRLEQEKIGFHWLEQALAKLPSE